MRSKSRGPATVPQLDARRVWNDHVGQIVASRTLWQIAGLIGVATGLLGMGWAMHVSATTRFIPYVVEVDQLGRHRAVREASTAEEAREETIRNQVGLFIRCARTVTADRALLRDNLNSAFAVAAKGHPAAAKLKRHLTTVAKPMERAKSESAVVHVTSVLRLPGSSTWEVSWTETVYDRTGEVISGPFGMQAMVTVRLQPPPASASPESFAQNPFGVYVVDYDWSTTDLSAKHE